MNLWQFLVSIWIYGCFFFYPYLGINSSHPFNWPRKSWSNGGPPKKKNNPNLGSWVDLVWPSPTSWWPTSWGLGIPKVDQIRKNPIKTTSLTSWWLNSNPWMKNMHKANWGIISPISSWKLKKMKPPPKQYSISILLHHDSRFQRPVLWWSTLIGVEHQLFSHRQSATLQLSKGC